MRLPRLLAILVLLATGIASFALAAAGCGGSDPAMMTDDGGTCAQRGTIAIDVTCASNCDCADPDSVCTLTSYDRKTAPVCTFTCDLSNPNPKCPMGCNMKGYCKLN